MYISAKIGGVNSEVLILGLETSWIDSEVSLIIPPAPEGIEVKDNVVSGWKSGWVVILPIENFVIQILIKYTIIFFNIKIL